MIARLRSVLAVAAAAVIWIDPSHVHGPARLTFAALGAYCVYSVLVYAAAIGRLPALTPAIAWSHWADLGWVTLLVALSGATGSIFFVGYFFAILIASFRGGFVSGTLVTLSSFVLYLTLAYTLTPGDSPEIGRALVRPVYLLVLGYMIAYWGGFHVSLTERLRLLKEVIALSNPRFGIERTIANVLRRLRTFYRADACMLIMPGSSVDTALVWRSGTTDSDALNGPAEIPAATIGALLALPASESVAFTNEHQRTDDAASDEQNLKIHRLRAIAEALTARSFMTVAWPSPGRRLGRLYVTSKERRSFESFDVDFLRQVVDQVTPTLENVRLVDRLATDAAEAERLRIARDLHDSVVQPYIGIRMGLAAIRQKLEARQDVTRDLEHLGDVISLEIDDLRRYLRDLKAQGTTRGALSDALSRFAHRFTDATGIEIALDVETGGHLNDRLAAETFQMVVEAVSNVRRHTDARDVAVHVRADRHMLTVVVTNAGTAAPAPNEFAPRSISERAAALGGRVHVRDNAGGGSTVTVEIPL